MDTPHPSKRRPDLRSDIAARFAQVAVGFVLQAFLLFAGSGSLLWPWAWLMLGIFVAVVSVNSVLMLRSHPETIAERGHPQSMMRWDKVVSLVWSLALYIVLPLTAGLDERFDWTPAFHAGWNIAGACGLACGLAVGSWAMLANAFFSTVVRIQTDRGHTVCDSGPYRYMRHPGYLGFILQSLATPLLLGSLWAFLPAGVAAAAMAVRTHMEDRHLRSSLPGYDDYAQRVRYRLLPGLW